jgi:hypothetical protein
MTVCAEYVAESFGSRCDTCDEETVDRERGEGERWEGGACNVNVRQEG